VRQSQHQINEQSLVDRTHRTGRHQENLIHNYYDYNPITHKSFCKVFSCGKEIKGKKGTNLMKHLQSFHKKEYKVYEKDEEMRKAKKLKSEEKSSSSLQSIIPTPKLMINSEKYYDKYNPITKGFMSTLLRLVSMTSINVSIVEIKEFRELIWFLDKRIPIPSAIELKNDINNYSLNLKQEICDKIQNSDTISLVADIIHFRQISKFFIRVTAYLFDNNDKSKCVLTLGLRPFPKPHKAEQIIERIQLFIQEYGISYEKIIRIITDNGSDLCQTFKIETLVNDKSFFETDYELDSSQQFDCDNNELENNETDFDDHELELNSKFKSFNIRRISSVVHSILCAIKICEKESQFEFVVKKALKLLRKICVLKNLTQNSFLNLNIKQLSMPTRWNFSYQQLKSFNEKKSQIETICSENSFQPLDTNEWHLIEEWIDLYKPFDDIIISLSKENETTISKVLSSYLFLKHELLIVSQNESKSDSMKLLSNRLTNELEKKFNQMLDPNNKDFNDGIYLSSAFLDPRFARILNETQLKTAKIFLREFYKQFIEKDSQKFENIENRSEKTTEDKKTSFEAFMEIELNRITSENNNTFINFDKQLVDWLHFISGTRISLSTDPLEFWRKDVSTHNYLDLKTIALNLLCIPSTTVPIETLFSTIDNQCFDYKNCLNEKSLETIIFFRSNAKYSKTLNIF
jgi:hypothetical protein